MFLSLWSGETRLCPDKSPMLRRANAHQLPVGRGHCLTKARCSLCRRGHKPNTCDNSGGRQGADRQVDDGFTCRPGGTGKTFNLLCTTMLSATARVSWLSPCRGGSICLLSGQRRVSPDSTESGGLLRHNIRLTRDCNWNCAGFGKVGKRLPEGTHERRGGAAARCREIGRAHV